MKNKSYDCEHDHLNHATIYAKYKLYHMLPGFSIISSDHSTMIEPAPFLPHVNSLLHALVNRSKRMEI